MPKLNIYIDGSWLFRLCKKSKPLSRLTTTKNLHFSIDFRKLNSALLTHLKSEHCECKGLNKLYFVTSIFETPDDIGNWANKYPEAISPENLDILRKSISAREIFAKKAVSAGYSQDGLLKPKLKPFLVKQLSKNAYREKQVDTTLVALIIQNSIANPSDYHCAIFGDADIIPAIQLALSETYSKFFMATLHPDQLLYSDRHTSFSILDFDFDISNFYLDEHIVEIMEGEHVYKCSSCNLAFRRPTEIDKKSRPYCTNCLGKRNQVS